MLIQLQLKEKKKELEEIQEKLLTGKKQLLQQIQMLLKKHTLQKAEKHKKFLRSIKILLKNLWERNWFKLVFALQKFKTILV